MEKNPEMKDKGERTWNMRKKDKQNIPITPAIYKTGYAADSLHPNANFPA